MAAPPADTTTQRANDNADFEALVETIRRGEAGLEDRADGSIDSSSFGSRTSSVIKDPVIHPHGELPDEIPREDKARQTFKVFCFYGNEKSGGNSGFARDLIDRQAQTEPRPP